MQGNFANQPQFFGATQAETVALDSGSSNAGSWNDDSSYTIRSTEQWFRRGGNSNAGIRAGNFSFNAINGTTSDASHRTILLGY